MRDAWAVLLGRAEAEHYDLPPTAEQLEQMRRNMLESGRWEIGTRRVGAEKWREAVEPYADSYEE